MGCSESKNKESYLIESFKDHEEAINCIAVSEDMSLLATGSEDKTIRMWSSKTDEVECLGVLKGHKAYITCLAICDTFVISGSADKTIRKWDMTTCECVYNFEGHKSRISRVICTGTLIFSTSYDKTAKVWDFDADEDGDRGEPCIRTFEGHYKGVYPLIFIPSLDSSGKEENGNQINPGDLLITGSADNTARSWAVDSGVTLKIFKGHRGPITCMATDPMGTLLYTGSSDTTIRSWEIASGKCIQVMEGHDKSVICLAVVNRLMYSGGQDGYARCWVREFGDCTRLYKGHKHSIIAIKFHDGILYTGCGDTCVRAFDAKSGSLKRMFAGHEQAVSCLTIVGEKLFSGSFDGSLRVWSLKHIKDDPDALPEEEDDDPAQFNNKQNQRLEDLDKRLDGYMNEDADTASAPAGP